MNSNEFRKELTKIMPGYDWTVHRNRFKHIEKPTYISATGIKSSGFNRLSTISVIRREKENRVEYEVKSAGFGLNAPWLGKYVDLTLARALRGLQNHYEAQASNYGGHASALENGRKKKVDR